MPRHRGTRMGDSHSSSTPVVAEPTGSPTGDAAAAEAAGDAAPLLAAADGLQAGGTVAGSGLAEKCGPRGSTQSAALPRCLGPL